jgi:alpha-glucosidase
MGSDVASRNVETLKNDERSLLVLYRRLIELRRREAALVTGEQIPLRSLNDVVAFKRTGSESELLILLNTVHQPRRFTLPSPGKLLLSTCLDRDGAALSGPMLLRPDEGVIIKLGA